MKVLLIDDDRDILTVVALLLEANKFEVNTLDCPANVQQVIAAYDPDIILLDIFLSGYDGRDICSALTSSSATRGIPVILFSAAPGIDHRRHGAVDFIKKPFEIKDLVNRLKQHARAV